MANRIRYDPNLMGLEAEDERISKIYAYRTPEKINHTLSIQNPPRSTSFFLTSRTHEWGLLGSKMLPSDLGFTCGLTFGI